MNLDNLGRQRKENRRALAQKAHLASPPATTVAPQCRRRRRPHQDMMHVAVVHFKCFRCFRGMFQVFHMDVAKVGRDVAYAAMVVHR